MDLSYGARLRQQRERRNVALATISEGTKIKLSLLEGLERNDLSSWPAGIFRRSYFRAYAQAIGLDPDSAVREFLERHPDPLDEFPDALVDVRSGSGSSTRPATRLRYLIDSAVSALPALRQPQSQHRNVVTPPQSSPTPDPGRVSTAGANTEPSLAPAPTAEAQSPLDIEPGTESGLAPSTAHAAVERAALEARVASPVDMSSVAALCTQLGRVADVRDLPPVFAETIRVLDAVGLIVWLWDPRARALTPVLSHGYADEVLAQLPQVPAESDNAIAAAFRAAETRVVCGSGVATGAVVAPLLTPSGCTGVLALELPPGGESRALVCESSAILAAQLATLVRAPALAHAVSA